MRTLPLSLLAFSMALIIGCPKPEEAKPTPTPPKKAPPAAAPEGPDWKSAISHEIRFDAEANTLLVDVTLKPGFHAYTVGETTGRPLALTIDEEKSARVLDGEVSYPAGKEKPVKTGKSVIVEGKAQISAKLKANEKAPENAPIAGEFHYQVCTEDACDRPRSEPFTVAVK